MRYNHCTAAPLKQLNQHLLGLRVQRSFLIGPGVQSEKPFDAEIIARQNALIHTLAVTPKLFNTAQDAHAFILGSQSKKAFPTISANSIKHGLVILRIPD